MDAISQVDGRRGAFPAHVDRAIRLRRISKCHGNFPAGYVKLEGAFLAQHREEVLALVRNLEHKEKAEHPLQRIMAIADDGGGMLVTTTDSHLARNLGEALHPAYPGELEIHYNPDDNLARSARCR